LNEPLLESIQVMMKARCVSLWFSLALVPVLDAQTCREVVRDSSGRVVETIERRTRPDGSVDSVTRDASGRLTGSATTRPTGFAKRTTFRDAGGRLAGSATTQATGSASARTSYRDASGRLAGSAESRSGPGATTQTRFRDASGRLTGSSSTRGTHGSLSSIQRDASGRLTGSSSGSGACKTATRLPVPPKPAKK
jgi:hypothetical protein